MKGKDHSSLETFNEIIADLGYEYALLHHNKEQNIQPYSEENAFVHAFKKLLIAKLNYKNWLSQTIKRQILGSTFKADHVF